MSSQSMPAMDADLFGDVWNVLDSHDEKDLISAHNTLGDLDAVAKDIHSKRKHKSRTKHAKKKLDAPEPPPLDVATEEKQETEKLRERRDSRLVVDTSYQGPDVKLPITQSCIDAMIEWFLSGKILHYRYVEVILGAILEQFQEASILQDISVPKGKGAKLVVCGDTHGQLYDVLTIFRLNGMPSAANVFLFNGDYVDRGPNSCEVLLLLYSLKLAYPNYIFLNRGNHEQRRVNERYSFEEEVRRKYDPHIFDVIEDSFGYLPFCCVIDSHVLVLHGGLWEYGDVSLDELRMMCKIKELPKHRDITSLDRNMKVLECALWSDPRDIVGVRPSHRGAGVEWGTDVTKDFLAMNRLSMVIRSHEMVSEGFLVQHDNQLVTIFSASYYCGTNANKGAVMQWTRPADASEEVNASSTPLATTGLQYKFVQYLAEVDVVASKQVTNSRIHETCYHETLQKLRERVYVRRHELLLEFSKADADHTGRVSKDAWCTAMDTGMGMQLRWLALLPYLAKVDEKGDVPYLEFLDRYHIKMDEKFTDRWRKHVVGEICGRIHAAAQDLTAAFNSMDEDGDGLVSYEEFCKTMKSYRLGLTDEQIYDMMRGLDTDGSSSISLGEFKERFSVEFDKTKGKAGDAHGDQIQVTPAPEPSSSSSSSSSSSDDDLVQEIARKICYGHHHPEKTLKRLFEKYAPVGHKHLTYMELVSLLTQYMPESNPEQLNTVARNVDTNHSGAISWQEFKTAFQVVDKHADSWVAPILEQLSRVIHLHRSGLMRAFRSMDLYDTHEVDEDQFKSVLAAMNMLLDHPLSEVQVKKLFHALDEDDDGQVNYTKFLAMFDVVDNKEHHHKK